MVKFVVPGNEIMDTTEAVATFAPVLYQLKITLKTPTTDEAEELWRRVVVPSSFSLLQLHVVIQDVFEWNGCYQHCFSKKPIQNPVCHTAPVEYRSLIGVDQMHFLSRVGCNTGVFVEHSHVHAPPLSSRYNKKVPIGAFFLEPSQVRDERVYQLNRVFNANSPKLCYEYDFGAEWVHEIEFEGYAIWKHDMNYPTCIDGRGEGKCDLRYEDVLAGGNQPPRKRRLKFRLTRIQQVLNGTYASKWPMVVDNTLVNKCYMCAWYHAKTRRCRGNTICTGRCCEYCLKADFIYTTVPLSEGMANTLFGNVVINLRLHRQHFLRTGTCDFVEINGEDCKYCRYSKEAKQRRFR